MTRQEILDEAGKITSQDRNVQYGDPEDNFQCIADLWNAYLKGRSRIAHPELQKPLTSQDVAILNILQKISRLLTSSSKPDHWIDIAGYAACGGGVATKEEKKEVPDGLRKETWDCSCGGVNKLSATICSHCGNSVRPAQYNSTP